MTPEALQELDNMVIDETELVSSILRESFYEFVLEMWDVIISETYIDNWHIKYLCDELQIVAERVFLGLPKLYDLIINIPPGTTKSTICSMMFTAWIWTRMPSARFIGASYAENLQMDLSRFCRDLIKSNRYMKYFPEVRITKDQDAKSYFLNTKGGRRKGIGVGGIAGFHGHFIVVDDPLDPKEANSEAKIEAANWWMNNSLILRKIEKDVTPTILIMQRICVGDCTDNMIENSEKGMIKHIRLPGDTSGRINPPELVKYYKDGLLDPVRISQKFLNSVREREYLYKAQILQEPIPLGSAKFQVEMINIEKAAPIRDIKIVRYWDKAGTKDGGAYSVGVKMGRDKEGRIWILDVVRGQWNSGVREKHIKLTAIMDGKPVLVGIEQEPGSGGKESAENTVKNLLGYRVKVDRPTGDKAQRADPFSSQVNIGNVYMVEASWNHKYIEELRTFSLLNSKYKDQVDASSGAFKILTEPIMRVGGGFLKQG